MNFDDLVDDLVGEVALRLEADRRPGAYRATVSAQATHRRAQVQPAWLESSAALGPALRCAPSLLDVVERPGARVVVISEDGLPERPIMLGAVCDEVQTAEAQTVWLRAHLDAPATDGHVELGATNGLRFVVGANTGGLQPVANQIAHTVGALEARLSATGSVEWSNATGDLLAQLDNALARLESHLTQQVAFIAAVSAAATLNPATPVTTGTLAGFLTGAFSTLATDATALAAARAVVATFKE